MAKRAAAKKAQASTYLTLGGWAEEAVRTMTCVILDQGVPNEHRQALDNASRALWEAVKLHRGWERLVLAQPTNPTVGGLKLKVDLGPIAATCAACGDQALIVSTPTGPGLAVCRTCSFQDRSVDPARTRRRPGGRRS